MSTTITEHVGYRQIALLLLLGCYNGIVSINHTLSTFHGYTPHFFCQVDNISATIQGCVKQLNSSAVQSELSCPQGYQFESDRGDWTVVTEGLQGTAFALLVELFPPKFRTIVATVIEVYWSVGLMFLAGASYFIPQWRPLELMLSLPTAMTLLFVHMVPESPRWLSTHGKAKEAQKVWQRILPHNNNITLSDNISCKKNSVSDEIKYTSVESQYNKKKGNNTIEGSVCIDSTGTGISSGKEQSNIQAHVPVRNTENEECQWSENIQCQKCCEDGQQTGKKTCNESKCKCKRNSLDETNPSSGEYSGSSSFVNHLRESKVPAFPDNIKDDSSSTSMVLDVSKCPGDKEELNHLWKEIVDELGFDEENKLSHEDILHKKLDAVETQNKRDEETLCFKNSESVDSSGHGSTDMTNYSNGRPTLERKRNIISMKDKVKDDSLNNRELNTSMNETTTGTKNKCEDSSVETSNKINGKISDLDTKKKQNGILDLFRSDILRKYNLIMVFVWFSVALSYYGIMFHLPGLSGERHLNFFLGAVLEVISFAVAYTVLVRYGRRLPMSGYALICGITCIAVGGVSIASQEDIPWIGHIQTALALLGKSSAISAFMTMYLFASELFPTVLRGAAMGHCGLWARVGSLLAPQLLFLGEYTMAAVPMLMIGLLGIVAGLLVLLLPETLGLQLPDTVAEAECLAKNKNKPRNEVHA